MSLARITTLIILAGGLIAGCGRQDAASTPQKADAGAPAELKAPAGTYELDANHSSLHWKVSHLGLSRYTARFTRFNATLQLDPANIGQSSIALSIDPTSVRTDFPGDYKGTHKDSPYQSFDEDLAQNPKWFNASQHPTITFKSTKVEEQGKGRYRVTGDLTFLGQTHPVTMDATLVGSFEKHPFTGRGVLGFNATTTFKRSTFGSTNGLPHIGDEVTIIFEGEFQQAAPAPGSGTGSS